MNFSEQLEKIFVAEEEIPEEFKLPSEVHQRTYISNGKLKQWDGFVQLLNEIVSREASNFLSTKFIF